MIYSLEELLTKMGAPEVKERGHMRWHYFDTVPGSDSDTGAGGFAEIRLEDGILTAEMQQTRSAEQKDENQHDSFYLRAERTKGSAGGGRFEVTEIAFDGTRYAQPQKPVIELGLSIFHARALDISILMVEHAFNRQDIVRPVIDTRAILSGVPIRRKEAAPAPEKATFGTVIPFRPRAQTSAALH